MSNILILFSTTDGQAFKICQKIQSDLQIFGHSVSLLPVVGAGQEDLGGFDAVVIGASIRYGKHKPEVADFIGKHRGALSKVKTAFFSVNVVARKADKNTPETNPYLKKFFSTQNWRPDLAAVFAGKIHYQKYRLLDRWMIRFIMFLTKGPTDPSSEVEFTDWNSVEAFGKLIAAESSKGVG